MAYLVPSIRNMFNTCTHHVDQIQIFLMSRDSKLPQQCKWVLRFYRILCSVDWLWVAYVSAQPVGSIFKNHTIPWRWERFVSPKFRCLTTNLTCVAAQKREGPLLNVTAVSTIRWVTIVVYRDRIIFCVSCT